MNSNFAAFVKKYPWLTKSSEDIADYIPPEYYDRLLKKYIFDGLIDLEYFQKYLEANFGSGRNDLKVLELGSGSGRATNTFFETIKKYEYLDLVDLSHNMHVFTEKRFSSKKNLRFLESDTIKYFKETTTKYDLVFSLWSFSHSVHQHLIFGDFIKASRHTERTIKKFVEGNVRERGKMFIIHYDTLSDEQRIKMRVTQWRKAFPIFEVNQQSPSKQLLDRTLSDLKDQGVIDFQLTHYKGEAIEYKSIDEALEIFMNFHMETYFNKDKDVGQIIKELETELLRYKKNDKVFISPGCFIYNIQRLH